MLPDINDLATGPTHLEVFSDGRQDGCTLDKLSLSGGQVLGASEIAFDGSDKLTDTLRAPVLPSRSDMVTNCVFLPRFLTGTSANGSVSSLISMVLQGMRNRLRRPVRAIPERLSDYLLGTADPYRRLDQAYLAIVVGALASC